MSVRLPEGAHAGDGGEERLRLQFIAPKDGCLGGFTAGYQRFFPEFTGQVFVDESSGHVLKSEEKTVGMPLGFDFRYVPYALRRNFMKNDPG